MNTQVRNPDSPAGERLARSASQPRISLQRLALAGSVAAIAAAAADLVVYSLGRANGVSMVMPYQWGQPPAVLPVGVMAAVVLFAAILATVTFGLLVRFAGNGVRVFQIASVPTLLLTFAGPLSLSQTAGSTKATLMVMHVFAAASIVAALSLLGRPGQIR